MFGFTKALKKELKEARKRIEYFEAKEEMIKDAATVMHVHYITLDEAREAVKNLTKWYQEFKVDDCHIVEPEDITPEMKKALDDLDKISIGSADCLIADSRN